MQNAEHALIYIVDDDPAVLALLQMFVSAFDDRWEVLTFGGFEEFKQALDHRAPQLVISDQRMPRVTGSELLDIVRVTVPQAVRMLISGHAPDSKRLAAAHQYLAKPFEGKELEARIRQALSAQELLREQDLGSALISLQSFPVMPDTYAKLVRVLESEDSDVQDIAALVARDAGALSKLLQTANSPLFRGATPVTDACDAIQLLGTQNVKALILSLHVFDSYNDVNLEYLPIEAIWMHSFAAAQLSRQICDAADMPKPSADAAFFAATVHDLGRLVLIENFKEKYRRVCQTALEEKRPLYDVEREQFRTSPAEVSGFMLRLWGMQDEVVDAVRFFHEPWKDPRSSEFCISDVLYLANTLTRRTSPPDVFTTSELDMAYLEPKLANLPRVAQMVGFSMR